MKAGFCRAFLLCFVPAAMIFGAAAPNAALPSAGWEEHPGYRMRRLQVPRQGKTGFSAVDQVKSGVRFTNTASAETLNKDSTLLSGAGVALGDVDGDGLCDIYLCSLSGENKLFRNLGEWRFEDITEKAGVGCPGLISRGAVLADVNGDGALDLLVTAKGGGSRLFLNNGKGVFRDFTAESGLATNTGSTSLALADVDGNGTLDLYVANFGTEMVLREGGSIAVRMINGRPTVAGRYAKKIRVINDVLVEFGEPDALYLNDGAGHFKAVPWDKGNFLDEKGQPAETPWDYGLAVQMRDLNGDGWPDIYVCNDFHTPDRIWLNDRKGHFRAIDMLAIRKSSFAAMGVDFADIDRDGRPDGFIIEMLAFDSVQRLQQRNVDQPTRQSIGLGENRPQAGRNTLLWNRGDGTFAEIAEFAGLAASDWSWTPVFLDVDMDGFEDLLIGTGPTYDLMNLDVMMRNRRTDPRLSGTALSKFPKLETPNHAFRNNGDRTFTECGKQWGFDSLLPSNAMALADLDGDGDLDIVINCFGANALLLRNESPSPRVAVRLKGDPPNVQGIGALITVRGGAVPMQTQEMISGGRYLAGDDSVRVFAAGGLTNLLTIEVAWRSGRHSLISDAVPNALYIIDEAQASAASTRPAAGTSAPARLFEDVSALLGHVHHEEAYDDLERQPLIPWRLSQIGPGAAWLSSADGKDQLVVGNGRHSALSVYEWNGKDRFEQARIAVPALAGDTTGMAETLLDGHPVLLLAQSSYENPGGNFAAVLELPTSNAPGNNQISLLVSNVGPSAVGPLAAGDLDGDGHLEVFVGGRVIPGRYPEPPCSYLLREQEGVLTIDSELSKPIQNAGLITSALFTDLDSDGIPELVAACEWGPVRVFKYSQGKLVELTEKLGLSKYEGLWQSVTTGDFDGDGRMDILAGNWGLNSRYKASANQPLVLFYGDFNSDGSVQIIETQYDLSGRLLPLKQWDAITAAMPFLIQKFPDYKSFSQATVDMILGQTRGRAVRLQATTLASTLFLNRGTHFEPYPLPSEAQWTPVFGIGVADFDGDGFEDALLAQNFFGTRSEATRLDAGRGLLLKGDGHGNFRAVPGQESGVLVYGEQRGCALADYDGDGRVDAVLCQNGAATKVLHNIGAEPGLLVRLHGPESNPLGLGATLRVGENGQWGPAREIHGGAGYYSQDSVRQVLSVRNSNELQVRWPGGRVTTSRLPAQAREIEVDSEGSVRVLR